MITDFDDFCLWSYVTIDDIVQQLAPIFQRKGPKPHCSDSELITITLIAECKGWDVETELLSELTPYRHLFPIIPSQSRFNRRRRNLASLINRIRQILLSAIDISTDCQCIIDSLPVPVIQFHLVPSSRNNWRCYDADYGRVESRKQTIFGYKLHLLITMSGVIVDFVLAPASASDIEIGHELLSGHQRKQVVGDKAYISAAVSQELAQRNQIELLTLPRRNQKQQVSRETKRCLNKVRQLVETVNGQLSEQFQIEKNHAHSFRGLCSRLYCKLTAHTLCIYLNRLFKKADFLQIKELAFPIP
jgi:IS5 family transposase